MPITFELIDHQTDLDISLSVRRKPGAAPHSKVAQMSGRSLPRSSKDAAESETDKDYVSAMSTKGIVFKNAGVLAQKYLSTKADFQYGIHYEEETGDYRVGHSPVTLEGDDLVLNYNGKEKKFKGTEGVWRLLTQDMSYFDEDDYFSKEDWETYMKILLITNQELAVRAPEEIPRAELLSARGEKIQISVFCREARYVQEIDELLRRLVDLRKVAMESKIQCCYTLGCLLFWITQRLIGTVGALGKKMDKLIEWIKLNKKLVEETHLLDLVIHSLPFGHHHIESPICDPRSLGESTDEGCLKKGTKLYKLYVKYLEGDKELLKDAKEGMQNLKSVFRSNPKYFEKFEISEKISGQKLNAALGNGLQFLISYYSN